MNKEIIDISERIIEDFSNIKKNYRYSDIPNDITLGNFSDADFIKSKFDCHDNIYCIEEVELSETAIVTGFGPTNTPTAGTLSVMLKAISLQKLTGIYTDIIISDLGAWNSRNVPLGLLEYNRDLFKEFIKTLGFDLNNGSIRSHQDKENLIISGKISKIMKEADFKSNKEATDTLYDLMELRGNYLGIMIDSLYTISDILHPLFKGNKRVLVLAGLEEHYFCQLARLAINRLNQYYPDKFISSDSKIGALYTKLIKGLYPYPKMSKSIPDSAINVSDSEKEIVKKIMECSEHDEEIILQMIELVSDWNPQMINEAKDIFMVRKEHPKRWKEIKKIYCEYFIGVSNKWKCISKRRMV